jgi:hypothetical protein
MDANKKSWKTWLLFGSGGALIVAGLVLQFVRPSVTSPPPVPTPVVTPTPPTPTPPPIPVVDPTPPTPTPVAEPTPPPVPQPPTPAPVERPKIEVVFALDTTSSMTGLIEGAKQKIWSIASRIATGAPTPELRVGLVPYRDRGDAYVTKVYPLTSNLDDVYSRLRTFHAEGGGDPPEDVRQALVDSIRKINWSSGKVMRIIFLVGDSPPHTDYADEPDEQAIAAEARRKGIVINTIRCGDLEDTAQVWRMIARASNGSFASIGQEGGMVAVKTPVDDRLRELNARLSSTAVYYGDDKDRRAAEERAVSNAGMAPEVQAESARYRSFSGHLDSNDLVGAAAAGKVKVEDMPVAALPAPMQAMAPAARKAYVEEKQAERARISSEVKELSKKRDEYLHRAAPASAGASFDDEVQDTIAKQAKGYGIKY